ncbi:MAG TPA: hypothetical protein VMF69_14765 [Gemmataceae bacterium]|nr:hypothetical protein [Gemmataceae bacterium]
MWTTLALMSALSCAPAQTGQLELKNPRFTYGLLGQERKDSNFLPGDMVVLSFDIEGLKVKPDGNVRYSMALKLFSHKKNKNVFERDAQEFIQSASLGGSHLPGFVMHALQPDTEPGDYTMRVDIKDVQGNTAQKLERKFTLKPLTFAIVNPGFVYLFMEDNQAGTSPKFAPPLAVPGQNLMLHFSTVGFAEAGEKNQPKVSVKAVIQDEAGKPVLEKPITGKVTEYPEEYRKLKFLPFQVPIQVNRSGKYKVLLTATDEISGKTTTFTPLDLTVLDVK